MTHIYEYVDEASIDPELICRICLSPFEDPYYASCDHTFCRECITHWIEMGTNRCPVCQCTLLIETLNKIPRPLQRMLDQLRVKCTVCGQTELERGNFDDHIQKLCPKKIVACSSADIKCPWTGQRDQLNQHLLDCRFEPMRPVITSFITENEQLKDQINRQAIEITARDNSIKEFLSVRKQLTSQIERHQLEKQQLMSQIEGQQVKQQNLTSRIEGQQLERRQLMSQIERQKREKQELEEQVNELTMHIGEQQNTIKKLKEEVRQLTTRPATAPDQRTELVTSSFEKNWYW